MIACRSTRLSAGKKERNRMGINIEIEDVMSLTEATKVLPKVNGKRPAISTLWRWCRRGLRGVHLEYIRVGRNIATSRQALNRFFTALAEADEPLEAAPAPRRRIPRPTPKARQRAINEAEKICAEAGI